MKAPRSHLLLLFSALLVAYGIGMSACASAKPATTAPSAPVPAAPAPTVQDAKPKVAGGLFDGGEEVLSDIDPNDVAAVAHHLSRHEYVIDVTALFRLTPDPPGTLLAVAADDERPTSIRLRAFDTMAFVADERVRAIYKRAVSLRSAGKFRHHAIVGLARAWPGEAVASVGPLLAIADDPQIRVTAASALVSFCGPDGRALVAEAASVEPELWVKEKLTELAAAPGSVEGGDAPPQ